MLPLHHPSELVMTNQSRLVPAHATDWGELYQGDCLDLLRSLPDGCADLVFADPPFNLGKKYGEGIMTSSNRRLPPLV
jgi:site-specific DNA-methyltransferase (adenine-specific)